MKFPKLKNPMLCQITLMIVMLVLPILLGIVLPVYVSTHFLNSNLLSILFFLAGCVLVLYILLHNFQILMMISLTLEMLHCNLRAWVDYPIKASEDAILRRASRFGTACDPMPLQPQPEILRYRFSNPWTVYNSGIEKVVAVYRTDYLDSAAYGNIVSSAKTNSNRLNGRKKAFFLDKNQKKAKMHRVTVPIILARRIDLKFRADLYDRVCKGNGDDFDNCTLPCVIDLESGTCTFSSVKIPAFFGIPVKNRGIRVIRRLVFGGRFSKGTQHPPMKTDDMGPETSLWEFWAYGRRIARDDKRETKHMFASMDPGQVRQDEDFLYVRWEQYGLIVPYSKISETNSIEIAPIDYWSYPKSHAISKQAKAELKEIIKKRFPDQTVTFS